MQGARRAVLALVPQQSQRLVRVAAVQGMPRGCRGCRRRRGGGASEAGQAELGPDEKQFAAALYRLLACRAEREAARI